MQLHVFLVQNRLGCHHFGLDVIPGRITLELHRGGSWQVDGDSISCNISCRDGRYHTLDARCRHGSRTFENLIAMLSRGLLELAAGHDEDEEHDDDYGIIQEGETDKATTAAAGDTKDVLLEGFTHDATLANGTSPLYGVTHIYQDKGRGRSQPPPVPPPPVPPVPPAPAPASGETRAQPVRIAEFLMKIDPIRFPTSSSAKKALRKGLILIQLAPHAAPDPIPAAREPSREAIKAPEAERLCRRF
jgi:hypothetical protein